MALKMEKDVTGAKKNMIDICSSAGQDDPHAADWLTGTWLEEHLSMTVGGDILSLHGVQLTS